MDVRLSTNHTTAPPSARPPGAALTRADVRALAAALTAYHAEFAPCFRRAEQRHWAHAYPDLKDSHFAWTSSWGHLRGAPAFASTITGDG